MRDVLELTDVTKVYRGGTRAVDGLSLTLGHGMLGLLEIGRAHV